MVGTLCSLMPWKHSHKFITAKCFPNNKPPLSSLPPVERSTIENIRMHIILLFCTDGCLIDIAYSLQNRHVVTKAFHLLRFPFRMSLHVLTFATFSFQKVISFLYSLQNCMTFFNGMVEKHLFLWIHSHWASPFASATVSFWGLPPLGANSTKETNCAHTVADINANWDADAQCEWA